MAYTRVNWINYPKLDTPINATNLNKMDKGIYDNSISIDNLSTSLNDVKGEVLFSSESGNAEAFDLSQSSENYYIFDIFAKTNNDEIISQRVIYPNGKDVLLIATRFQANNDFWIKCASININNKHITFNSNVQYYMGNNTATQGNYIFINYIIGYKNII